MNIQTIGKDVEFELVKAARGEPEALRKVIERWRTEHAHVHIYGIDFLSNGGYTDTTMIAYRPGS